MRCLVVGTDSLGCSVKILQDKFGIKEVVHWSGRKRKLPRYLPSDTSLVVIYFQFVNHSLMHTVKKLAKKNNIEMKFVKRGLSEIIA